MKLIGMLDSPYVRRVAISLELYGKIFEHQPLSVFGDYARFADINPAVKAPTLVLDDGTVLMDSSLILQYLEANTLEGRHLLPRDHKALADDTRLLGLVLAASEKTVQHVYEHHLRPAEKRHQPWIDRVTQQLLSDCALWNVAMEGRDAKRDQVAITSAVVWGFIQLMVPHVIAAKDYPYLQAHAQQMEAFAEFIKYPIK
ncbi:glutathione S-transferase family protein [Candidatus Pantoea formicae]|uniref:glutathione S-transferase family protein n=1 Tax=Candidatus Pantoea formicae TaxID=2608355 RepID=UPI003ED958CC